MTVPPTTDEVRVDREEPVLTITLDSPRNNNRLTRDALTRDIANLAALTPASVTCPTGLFCYPSSQSPHCAILPDALNRLRDHQFNVARGELRDDPDQAPVHNRTLEERKEGPTAEPPPDGARGR